MDYYGIPRVSNSSLTELTRMLEGGSMPSNIEQIFSFGRLTDELILEPEKADLNHPDLAKASRMRDRFLADSFLRWLLAQPGTKRQEIILFEKMGVLCKMKADVINKPAGFILELKTTAATTEKQFVDSLTHFNYDRQAAFYLDGSGTDKCLFIGISKKAPHTLFKYGLTINDPMYQDGKAKYEKLLQLCRLYEIGTD